MSEKAAQIDAQRSVRFWNVCKFFAAPIVVFAFIAEMWTPTNYGKFGLGGNASMAIGPRLGWWLMEMPCWLVFIATFPTGRRQRDFVPRLFAAVFLMHYLYRGWIFPTMIRVHEGSSSNFSLLPAVGGWMVTICHGWLNARWFGEVGTHLTKRWLRSWKFLLGAALYYSGLAFTIYHDHIMRTLRDGTGPRCVCVLSLIHI